MTPDESFQLYLSKQDLHGLPWQTPVDEVRSHFTAGWAAALEAQRQTEMFSPAVAPSNIFATDAAKERIMAAIAHPLGMDGVKAETPVTAADIYAAYPRKVGKQAALKAIEKAIKVMAPQGATGPLKAAELLERTKAYAAAVAKWPAADKQFVPHPATWFNRGSYEDDPKEWQRGCEYRTGPSIRTVN